MNDISDNNLKNRILYEDNHLIIVNKYPGEIVQGDKTGDLPLLENVRQYLKVTYDKPGNVFCGLVHRIDRPVSGVVIFAKTSKALSRMNLLVKNREITKIYWAIVEKLPQTPEDTLIHYLKKNEKLNKSFVSVTPQTDYLKSELSYKTIGKTDRYGLLEVILKTGRHHQIRAQLSAIGSVIKGDLKYGARRSNPDGSISLHAARIVFAHPVTQQIIDISAPPLSEQFVKIWTNA